MKHTIVRTETTMQGSIKIHTIQLRSERPLGYSLSALLRARIKKVSSRIVAMNLNTIGYTLLCNQET